MLQKSKLSVISLWKKSEEILNVLKNVQYSLLTLLEQFLIYFRNSVFFNHRARYMHQKTSICQLIHDTDQK